MKIKKHFEQIIIKQTLDKVDKLFENTKDPNVVIAVGVSDNYSFDVYLIDYIGQFKKYPSDICEEQSKDRIIFHVFPKVINSNYYTVERNWLISELKSYVKHLDVCSNGQTNILKLSTRGITNE